MTSAREEDGANDDDDIQLIKLGEQAKENIIQVTKTYPEQINEWIWWTVFLPITLPLTVTKCLVRKTMEWTIYIITMLWSTFCIVSLTFAAFAVYVPVIGEKLSQICLFPSKIDRIPQHPFFHLACDMLKLSARVVTQEATNANF